MFLSDTNTKVTTQHRHKLIDDLMSWADIEETHFVLLEYILVQEESISDAFVCGHCLGFIGIKIKT